MHPALVRSVPDWLEVRSAHAQEIEGLARVRSTKWETQGLALTLSGNSPLVRETIPGTELPTWCIERHIVGRAEFCVRLYREPVRSCRGAERWWDQLAQFIACQSVADETGLWPLMNGLDHGSAAKFHNRALDLATELGIFEEYLSIHAGYASDYSPETIARLEGSDAFRRLRHVESERWIAKLCYDIDADADRHTCCGTMRNCPFRREAELPKEQTHLTAFTPNNSRASLLSSVSRLGWARP